MNALLHSCICWLVALGVLGVACWALYFVSTRAGAYALQRERESHLKILNAARLRSGKPPLSMEEFLAGEGVTDVTLPRAKARGFEVAPPSPSPAPQHVIDDTADDDLTEVPDLASSKSPAPQALPEAVEDVSVSLPSAQASIVLLEREFRSFNTDQLRGKVERAWDVLFPLEPGSAEYVLAAPVPLPSLIACGGFRFAVRSVPRPYFTLSDTEIAALGEERTRQAVRDGTAFHSIELLRDDTGEGLSRTAAYALLGKLAAELTGNATLGLYLPELRRFFPYTDDTLRALTSDDVIHALETAYIDWVPVVPDDDAELLAAMEEARRRFPEFVRVFDETRARRSRADRFEVRAPLSDGTHTEHLWLAVSELTPDLVHGVLRSSPVHLKSLVPGLELTVPLPDVSDWLYTVAGSTTGNFTAPVLEKRRPS